HGTRARPAGRRGLRHRVGVPAGAAGAPGRRQRPASAPRTLPGDAGRAAPILVAAGDIAIQETARHSRGDYAFPAASADDVTVNGHPATYVHGSYHGDGQWDSNVDASTMSWEAGGITYVLSSEAWVSVAPIFSGWRIRSGSTEPARRMG